MIGHTNLLRSKVHALGPERLLTRPCDVAFDLLPLEVP